MIPGVRGRLITASFARERLSEVEGTGPMPPATRRAVERWWRRSDATLGPASSVRAICDGCLVPLLGLLGFTVTRRADTPGACWLTLAHGARAPVAAVAVGWNEPHAWRLPIVETIAAGADWCFCCNGTTLRILDARRTWSREHLEFDLAVLAEEPAAQALLWSVARAEAMALTPPALDRAARLSVRHGVDVCRALGAGVLEALQLLLGALAGRTRGRYTPHLLFEHTLTVLYRVLFLLFAEARGLVPVWHPIYRDRYSLDGIVSTLLSGGCYRGLWHALQAISRLAHAGCSAGELTVTAFNGRLFSPAQAAAFDRTRVDDEVMGRAVVAVSTTPQRGGRARIAYRDLDVEQLGAVYEQVLEYEAAPAGSPTPLLRTGDIRKATGTFYTPRAVTTWLVRRTLEPLVNGRAADDILRMRVLDPAMGSGAFLVAACRFLASAAEEALVREGRWHAHDITPADRAALRREVASRCLFGADLNPMAVQLARLSLWLATLATGKPLSFLDHHLVAGDSLVGATPDDVRRQPGGGRRPGPRQAALPLLAQEDATSSLLEGARVRLALTRDPDDSAAIVRAKERALAGLRDPASGLGRWWRVLDLWCAGWFWEGAPPDRGTFATLVDQILHDRRALPQRLAIPILSQSERIASSHRFLHWPLAFPEVFAGAEGTPGATAGFDAVVGNPPWDMVRGDSGEGRTRDGRRADARHLTAFLRDSGVYRVEAGAHANRYQLFLERALQLVRPGGRIGLVLPSGIASDAGAAPLRRHLFDRAAVDDLVGLDNREGIFPIHRSMRFVLLACTAGAVTQEIRCRFGITQPDDLDRPAAMPGRAPVVLTRRFLARLSGEGDLGIPELAGPADLRLLERLSATIPRLGADDGWHVHFGRELNATDDRHAFRPFAGDAAARPVIEGKRIDPFRVSPDPPRFELRPGHAAGARVPRRARLAYRDVASATNRLTLIAAVLPPHVVTTHTLFCLKTPLARASQHALCALLNSYVANYLVRLRVNTHVTIALVSRLPVPVLHPGGRAHHRLAALARAISSATRPVEEMEEYAQLQALCASLYGLTPGDFEHVLSTFPLVGEAIKRDALRCLESVS